MTQPVKVMMLGLNLKKPPRTPRYSTSPATSFHSRLFFVGNKVLVSVGLLMGAGQMLGAFLGSRLVIQRGTGFVRIFFLVVVAVTIIKLGYSTYAAQ